MKGEYYKTKESVKEYIKLAQGVNGKGLIEKFQAYMPPNASVLEIGSGPGSDWEILNKMYNVTGSDNSTEFLRHLRSGNPDSEFLHLDAVTLESDKKFDGIYSNKVMHHLTDEALMQSVERQHEMLNANGVVCHSFWKGEGSEIFKGLFVNYHNEAFLKEVFKKHFEFLSIETYKEFEEGDSLLYLGRKK